MTRDPDIQPGRLPHDAEMRLKATAKIGTPGSMTRIREINRVYTYIETHYPQYLKRGAN